MEKDSIMQNRLRQLHGGAGTAHSGKLFLASLPESGRRGRSGLRRLAQAATARLRGLPPEGDDPRRGGVLTHIRPVRTL